MKATHKPAKGDRMVCGMCGCNWSRKSARHERCPKCGASIGQKRIKRVGE